MLAPEPLIRAFDYLRGHESRQQEFADSILRVLRSGQLILGQEGRLLEEEFAAFVGAREAIGVGSGTDALILALLALKIGPGDEVITVANTAVPTASAIRAVGAIPRFVDVRRDTLLMDPDLTAAAVNSRTRCLLPVHLHGLPVDLAPFRQLADRCGLSLVEDCAHAHGTRLHEIHVGTGGDIGCFSFYPTKNLGAYGDAGMCVTQNSELAERLRALRTYGFDENRVAQSDGRNSRLDELQAAILRVKLRHLDDALESRRKIAARYFRGLAGICERDPTFHPAATIDDATHSFHQFVIRTDGRPQLIAALNRHRIGFGIHYDVPLHHMPAFRRFHQDGQELPETDRAAKQILSLPMYPELPDTDVDQVIAVVLAELTKTVRA